MLHRSDSRYPVCRIKLKHFLQHVNHKTVSSIYLSFLLGELTQLLVG
jgi:hypothetical protein